tara:strand:+ start:411 stop:1160 length:750 start_codon:yes stop_codon:yes gene_type:complete
MVKKSYKPQAIITGAGSGIGRATTKRFYDAGYSICCIDIDQEKLDRTLNMIDHKGLAINLDISNANEVKKKSKEIGKLFNNSSVLINSAGISPDPQPVHLYKIKEWKRVIEINLSGTFYLMKYLIPLLLKNAPASIVNLSSVMGVVANPTTSGYSASKHGVVGLTKAAALDYANQGLRVNCIGPGVVETNMTKSILSDEDTKILLQNQTPLGRFSQAEEIAELIYFLCSKEAKFITGTFIPIDGGYTAV